ncbi:MAG: hypothetical protein KDF65_01255 [Anaerolineae bacterium]|nr:hypothetical protein [Anaerolineae bacterium]
MFQIAYDYEETWPEDESFRVEGHFAHQINVSPTVARRKANGFLAGYISMMVSAEQPTLRLSDTPFWQVPAVLTLPGLGETAVVGTIKVDAQSGNIIPLSPPQIKQMQELGYAIATHFASSPAPTG